MYTVVGAPYRDQGKLRNSAFVIGPDGTVLTRYDQMAVEQGGLFAPGSSPKSMWFRLKGVPGVVTIGKDGLWNEIAEMTAQAGAQLHVHIAYDRTTGSQADLRRMQIWAGLASFKTFTATVNAASSAGEASPSLPTNGGSAIWDDLNGLGDSRSALKTRQLPPDPSVHIYSPWSANCIVKAGVGEQLIYATRRMNRANPHQESRFNPQMLP